MVRHLLPYSTGYAVTGGQLKWINNFFPIFEFTNTRSGSSNRNWRSQISQGIDATTTFSGAKLSLKEVVPYRWEVERRKAASGVFLEAGRGYLQVSTPNDPSNLSITEANNQSLRSLHKKLAEARSAFRGSTFVAEIGGTLRTLRNPARSLRRGLDDYHKVAKERLRRAPIPSHSRILADTWLEYNFGWRPLVNDIESAITNLNRIRPFDLKRVTSFGSHISSSSIVTGGPQSPGLATGHYYKTRTQSEVQVIYRAAIKLPLPGTARLDDWGFATSDFLPAVWEAIPYSFVVDYFTNIGDIITAFSNLLGDISWANRTTRKINEILRVGSHLTKQFDSSPDYPIIRFEDSRLGRTVTTLTRVSRTSVNVSDLLPSFNVRVPGVGSTAWLNLAALARLRLLT